MTERGCTREGCQVATTGKCLEGFDPPNTCPYLPESQLVSAETGQPEQGAFVSLPKGEALSDMQASEVAREAKTNVVILAGPHGSGKTTILTSLFESFLEAPFANYSFAGSRTLIGFERRCHDAREASERRIPHTGHTPVSDVVEFLHLRVRSASPSAFRVQNLLLSDISGERFRALRDSADAVKGMEVLGRADHLCIVVDGSRLADPDQRHSARNDARTLLRAIAEGANLSPRCRVEIVFSKWDLVLSSPDQESTRAFIEGTSSAIGDYAKKFTTTSIHQVAARPTTKSLPFAHGVANLLRTWLEEPTTKDRSRLYLSEPKEGSREFSRFSKTIAGKQGLEETYDVKWV